MNEHAEPIPNGETSTERAECAETELSRVRAERDELRSWFNSIPALLMNTLEYDVGTLELADKYPIYTPDNPYRHKSTHSLAEKGLLQENKQILNEYKLTKLGKLILDVIRERDTVARQLRTELTQIKALGDPRPLATQVASLNEQRLKVEAKITIQNKEIVQLEIAANRAKDELSRLKKKSGSDIVSQRKLVKQLRTRAEQAENQLARLKAATGRFETNAKRAQDRLARIKRAVINLVQAVKQDSRWQFCPRCGKPMAEHDAQTCELPS